MKHTHRWLNKDAFAASGIFLGLLVIYTLLAKGNLTIDGGNFVAQYGFSEGGGHPHIYHLLYNRILYVFITAGRALGFSAQASGTFSSALFMAAAVAVFALLLRRCGAGWPAAIITSLLFGLNDATIENATSVEIYGCAVFAVVLTLHAFRSEAENPTRLGGAALFAFSILVLLFHVGFSFWVLAIYLALSWKERSRLIRIPIRLAQGAGTALLLLIMLITYGMIGAHGAQHTENFFEMFWKNESAADRALSVIEAPLFGFAMHAGLLLFPSGFGWGIYRRRFPAEAFLMPAALLSFMTYYSFWVIDYGTFYLPVQVIWGVFAGLAVDAVLRSRGKNDVLIFILAACIYFIAFLFVSRSVGFFEHTREKWTLSVAFWIWCVLGAAAGAQYGEPASNPVRWIPFGVYSVIGLAAAGVLYLPRALAELQPDKARAMFTAFQEITPENALFLSSGPTHRIWAETERVAVPAFGFLNNTSDWTATQRLIGEWIRQTGKPGGSPLFIDSIVYTRRREIWRRYPPIDVPMEKLVFEPITSGEFLFYQVKFADPEEAKLFSANEDLHDPEDWGGISVRWTRKVARVKFKPYGSTLLFRYFVGSPNVSASNPQTITVQVDGGEPHVFKHDANGYYEQKIDISTIQQEGMELRIECDRTFVAEDGRTLGIGFYPLDFE